MSKVIAFAGLPGTGKTKLAKALAERLGAVCLNKDELRAALFSGQVEYSDRQNDFVMQMVYQLAEYHAVVDRQRHIVIDGRTFSKREQVAALKQCAVRCGRELLLVECVCSAATAEARITADVGRHVAADRSVELYRRVRAGWGEIDGPKLVVETEGRAIGELVEIVMQSMRAG